MFRLLNCGVGRSLIPSIVKHVVSVSHWPGTGDLPVAIVEMAPGVWPWNVPIRRRVGQTFPLKILPAAGIMALFQMAKTDTPLPVLLSLPFGTPALVDPHWRFMWRRRAWETGSGRHHISKDTILKGLESSVICWNIGHGASGFLCGCQEARLTRCYLE